MDITQILTLLPIPIGTLAVLIGVSALIIPQKMAKNFGIEIAKKHTSYIKALGIRDVFIGLIILTIYYKKSWELLAPTVLFIGIVATSDFLVVFKNGDKKTSFIHFLGALFSFAYSALLFLQF